MQQEMEVKSMPKITTFSVPVDGGYSKDLFASTPLLGRFQLIPASS